ncbi:hypothetical protein [uncultured Helicobacter sp.]|uniref:hypothetical protein n=1 Tax=uncultured Helicobacter sp. TaxID=175537 RepID=UPI00375105E3
MSETLKGIENLGHCKVLDSQTMAESSSIDSKDWQNLSNLQNPQRQIILARLCQM